MTNVVLGICFAMTTLCYGGESDPIKLQEGERVGDDRKILCRTRDVAHDIPQLLDLVKQQDLLRQTRIDSDESIIDHVVYWAPKKALLWGREILQQFLNLGVPIDQQNCRGETALITLIKYQRTSPGDGVRTLLKYGASMDAIDDDGYSALSYAFNSKDTQYQAWDLAEHLPFRVLVNQPIMVPLDRKQLKQPPLQRALERYFRPAIISSLVKAGAHVGAAELKAAKRLGYDLDLFSQSAQPLAESVSGAQE